ncbi:MAG TPA: DNA-directed RNA polymerase subunit omega [Chthoniobacteraceae bacterium]|nr:DNA-directed RNA polymerase subunit omega [Chthoniobacteraceae bacterium]
MTTHLLEEASLLIPNQQVLINVVSRRVRQLSQGHRPMVEVGVRLDYADTALREIIEGKLTWEPSAPEEADPALAL